MSKERKVTVKCKCMDCQGTGLYVGALCRDGVAMVCRECKGSGYKELTYIPFTIRKKREGIKRIFQAVKFRNLWPTKHTFEDGTTIDFSKYGCSYEEWESGIEPKPLPED